MKNSLALSCLVAFLLLAYGCTGSGGSVSPPSSENPANPQPGAVVNPPAGCAGLSGVDQDKCYYALAIERADISVCDKMSKGHSSQNWIVYDKYSCYGEVAAVLKNPQICGKIVDIGDGFGLEEARQCYAKVAIAKQDKTICTELISKMDQAFCFTNVALAQKDESICVGIKTTAATQDSCRTGVAIVKSDISICQKNQITAGKTLCEQQVAKGAMSNSMLCSSMGYMRSVLAQYCP